MGGAVAAPARAGIVTWEFGGEIDQVRDTSGIFGGALTVGSPFSGSFTFDTSTPDTNPDSGVSSFENPLQDLSGQIGGFGFSGPIFGVSSFEITDGAAGSDDIFSLSSSVFLNGEGLNFLLTLIDSTGTAFSDDTLPTVPPDLSLFDSATIHLLRQTGDLAIDGTISFLVPEPGTLCLLAVGAVAILRRRRRT